MIPQEVRLTRTSAQGEQSSLWTFVFEISLGSEFLLLFRVKDKLSGRLYCYFSFIGAVYTSHLTGELQLLDLS